MRKSERVPLEALLLNAAANLDKQTICTVQSAPSSMERHLMWARFMVLMWWRLNYLKLRKIEAFSKYNYLKLLVVNFWTQKKAS